VLAPDRPGRDNGEVAHIIPDEPRPGDPTAHASLSRRVDLTVMADSFVLGWKHAVMIELDRMRQEMPYADTLELRLICERRDA